MTTTTTRRAFSADSLAQLSALYPERPGPLVHDLGDHPLLSRDALADLAPRLPEGNVEYNRAMIPIGIMPEDVPANGLDLAETIRSIETNGSWAVLKHIETVPEYRDLLLSLLAELEPVVGPRTGAMLTPQGFIFLSSPNAITPFHFDPEHNILLQIRGTKVMHVWPAGDPRFAAPEQHERYYLGGHRNLPWDDGFAGQEMAVPLSPGEAVHMPVMAPHFVENGPSVSVSLSITWRSEWSYRNEEACAANALLRRVGASPALPPRWPRAAPVRSLMWKVARRFR